MSRLFSIHEAAEVEINEVADFYDLGSPGLGSLFIDEIQRTIERIQDEIRILAVVHQKRRPFYWRGRR